MKRTVKQFREELRAINERFDLPYDKRREMEDKLYADWYQEMEVGDRASVRLWSDTKPCTIIKKTAKSLTVRYDKAERDPNWKPEWVPGGFSAICTNIEDQKWIIEEDPNGAVETFRWHKNDNCYMNNGCRLTPGWHKYYDYNF